MPQYVMSVQCADAPGIVHAFSAALLDAQANIVDNAQYGDPITSQFCMRTTFTSPIEDIAAVRAMLEPAEQRFDAHVHLRVEGTCERVLIMVSQYDHCLLDLLYRWSAGELPLDIVGVVSNHQTCRPIAERHGLPFAHLPVTSQTKAEQEDRLLAMVREDAVDLVVLARYMQILSERACEALAGRVINIHHSFLPGFKGARPYHQAYERGVKLIGATAHFVTSDLDEGPIIEQQVARVSHVATPEDLAEVGRDVERLALSRAVRLFAEDRVFLNHQRTVVFGS